MKMEELNEQENTLLVENTVEEVKPPVEPKPMKEMKPKASQEKKPKQTKTPSHPPYFEEALLALKERNGSSPYAIAKYMEEKFKPVLPANFKKILSLQLKNQTMRGKLVKIKASYKLSEAEKKPKKEKKNSSAEKKQQSPKRKRNGTVGGKKSNKKKEVVKKKKVSGLAKPKQPKSIKSTTNKRARKANVATA